jgi:outer membrane protein assembly factor BamB
MFVASLYPRIVAVKRSGLCVALVWGLIIAGAGSGRADNWPTWRGPDMAGISKESNLPSVWSETKNIAWKLPLPGKAGSSPVIWGERIFLTSVDGNGYALLCIGTSGKEIWRRQLGTGGRKVIMKDEGNDASASPSTDGRHVYAYVGTGDLACFDLDGKQVWKTNIQDRYGKFRIQHGSHNTPLLHGDRLYLSILHNGGHWVVALDKASGQEVWKVERKTDAIGESREAYSSPILWSTGKDTTLVILGCDYATGHRLSDGAEIWRLADLNPVKNTAFRIISTPVASSDLLVVPTCRGGLIAAVKPGPTGTIHAGSAYEQWRRAKGGPDVPSPLIRDGLVYLVQADRGIFQCWDAATAKEYYNERIHEDRYRASPVYADGKVYILSRDGTALVIKAGRTYEPLATNKLADNFTASPAIANGRIYLRGFNSLYAIQESGK